MRLANWLWRFDRITGRSGQRRQQRSFTQTSLEHLEDRRLLSAVANNDDAATLEDTAATISVTDNDSGVADGAAIVLLSSASHGSVALGGNGSVIYTPASNFSGSDSIQYAINENPAPTTANKDTVATLINSPVTISVLANDTDPQNDPLTPTLLTSPAHGTAVLNSDNTVTYTPFTGYTGGDSFQYQVDDGNGHTSSTTVSIDIRAATAGTLHYLPPQHIGSTHSNYAANLYIHTDNPSGASGTITVPGTSTSVAFTVTASNTFIYPLSNGVGQTGVLNTVENKGLVVQSNNPVSVEMVQENANGQYFLVSKSLKGLGTDFYAGQMGLVAGYEGGGLSEIAVMATQDNTQITIARPPSTTWNWQGTSTGTINVTLNAGQTYKVGVNVATSDMTGSRITSDKPIAVSSGSFGVSFVNGGGAGDNGFDQLVPVTKVGSRYIIVGSNSSPDVTDFVATQNNTEVRVDGTLVATINAGQYYRLNLTSNTNIASPEIKDVTTTAPVYAYQNSGRDPNRGENALSLVAPINPSSRGVWHFRTPNPGGGVTTDPVYITTTASAAASLTVTRLDTNTLVTPSATFSVPNDPTLKVLSYSLPISKDFNVQANAFAQVLIFAAAPGSGGGIGYFGGFTGSTLSATNDTLTVQTNTPYTFSPLNNDVDGNGDPFTISNLGTAAHGTVINNGNGNLTYTSAVGYTGADSFQYSITDGLGNYSTATVSINVTSLPTATVSINVNPVADTIAISATGGSVIGSSHSMAISVGNSSDTDGSETRSNSVIIRNVPASLSFSAGTNNLDGTWSIPVSSLSGLTASTTAFGVFNLSAEISNTDSATFSDNTTATDTRTFSTPFSLTFINPNHPPVVSANAAAVSGNEGSVVVTTGNFSDAEGDSTATISASIGTVTQDNTTGTWSWSLNATDGPDESQTVTITATDSAGESSTTTFQLTVNNVAPTVNPDPGSAAGLNASLGFYYPAEGNATDVIGGNNGTLVNGTAFAPGQFGQAFSFDGVNDEIITGTTTAMNSFPLTVAAWVKPELRSDGNGVNLANFYYPNNVISNDNPGLYGHGFGVNVTPSGSQFTIEYNNGFRVVPSVTFQAGQWYHVAVSYSSTGSTGQYKAYVNGNLVDTFSFAQGAVDGTNFIRIGSHNNDTGYGTRRFFKGLIDDVTIYTNNVLTDAEIRALTTGALVVNEGQLAIRSGTFSDPGQDQVAISASAGAVTQTTGNNGTWNWSLQTSDGGAQSQTITITGNDGDLANSIGTGTFQLIVNNVAPTATLSNGGAVNEGSTGSVSFSNQFDPSSDDTSAGFRYAFDFDNNGTFDSGNGSYSGSGTSASATVPASFLADGPATRTVKGRIIDKDGGFTDYTTTITVNNVAPSLAITNSTASSTAYYTNWTAANPGAGTASGTITLPDGSTVGVTFDALNPNGTHSFFYGAQTNGGTNYWNPSTPYISAQVPNAPPDADIIQLSGGSSTIYRVTLSAPIQDPIMAIVSLGNGGAPTTYDFDAPFTIVSQAAGYWGGNSSALSQLPGDILRGLEGHGTIKFLGTYSTFSWTVPTPETWHGFTFAIRTSQALASAVIVNEGQLAQNDGTWSDPGVDVVSLSANVGTVVKNAIGTWNWSYQTTDGPNQSQTVTITATDSDGAVTTQSFPLIVNNVAPIATLSNGGSVNEGSTGSVSFANQFDPSSVDTSAGLRYAFDFNNDGTFDSGNGSYSGSGTSASATVPASFLADGPSTRTVKGRIIDKEGGFTDYTTTITVNNVNPTATLSNGGPVNEGSTGSVSFSNQFDPSTADSAFRYAFDFDNNGTFDSGNGSYSGSGTSASATVPASFLADGPGTKTVKGRIIDKDGGFTDYTTTITINNVTPTVAVDAATVTVNEGQTATNTGTWFDPGIADNVTLTASIGTVTKITTAQISQAGSDLTTRDAWRTSGVVKSLDSDGNNIYGSDGYAVYGSTPNQPIVQPSYLTVTQAAGTNVFFSPGIAPDPGTGPVTTQAPKYTGLDDPDFTGVGPVADTITGTVYRGGQGANQEGDLLVFTVTTNKSFRLGVIQDNHDFAAISPLALRLRQTVGGSANSGLFSANQDRNRSGDYYFFDVVGAKAGDVFVLSGVNDGGHSSNGVWGVTFDSLPGGSGGNLWTWSYGTNDGPVQSQTVTITATDKDGASSNTSFNLVVNNVAPTATLNNGGPVNEGSTGSVSFANQFDPSSADSAFRYAFDFDNNGTFEIGNGTYTGSGSSASVTVPASFLADGNSDRTVRGRILDKDGGFTDYTTTIGINNVAPTISLSGATSVDEGSPYTLNLGAITDPGIDTVSSFSIDWGDGSIESFTGNPASTSKTHVYSDGPNAYQIRVSLTDEDGTYNSGTTQTIGNSLVNRPSLDSFVNFSIVDRNNAIPAAGVVTGWQIYAGDTTPVRLLVYRQSGSNYTLVGKSPLVTPAALGVNSFSLASPISVQAGDFLGYYTQSNGAVPYDNVGTGGIVYSANNAGDPVVGANLIPAGTSIRTYSISAAVVTAPVITVNNVAPTFEAGADETVQPPQLGAFSRTGIAIVDPGTPETFSGTVNFGDGSGNQTLIINQSTRQFDLSHTYPNTNADPAIATYHVTVTVNDGDGGSHTDAFDVTVNLNTPPVAEDDSVTTDEDHSFTFNVLANDHDNQNNIVPSLTTNLTSPAAGVLTNNGDGTFSYNPNGAFESLAVGESATVIFDYQVVDAFGETDIGTVTMTITGVNDGPSVSVGSTSVSVNEGQTATNTGSWSDIDASDIVTLTASVGSVTKNANGTWSWSFNTNDGPDQSQAVTIIANDGNGGIATTTFDLTVNNVAPSVANVGNVSVNEGSTVTNSGTWSDPGLDVVALAASVGTVTKNANGTWSWSFNSNDGPDQSQTVTITATDSDGASTTTSFNLTVNNVAPDAVNDSYSTPQATLLTGNVITGGGADTDPAGANDPLTVVAVNGVASSVGQAIALSNGTLTVNSNGSFSYQPDTTFVGTESFTYTISDGDGGFDTATVTITVNAAAGGSILTVVDTCCDGETALLITGTSANDLIVVSPGSTSATLQVSVNGAISTVARPSGRIIVLGLAGNDNIQIAGAISNPVWLYGDAGDDRLNAGNVSSEGNLLFGGDGNDDLLGGNGRDVLIGGQGADKITANADDDILIAGLTTHDARNSAAHEEFWCNVLHEWTELDPFATRVNRLRTGSGHTGANLLSSVVDDNSVDQIDQLQGSSGNDWFLFKSGEDKVVGQTEAAN